MMSPAFGKLVIGPIRECKKPEDSPSLKITNCGMTTLEGSNRNNVPPTMFAHVAVVLELNWFYNKELRSKQTLSIFNYLGRSGDFTKIW